MISIIQRLLCALDYHQWVLTDNDIEDFSSKTYRTYERCVGCHKWGKLIALTKVKKGEYD